MIAVDCISCLIKYVVSVFEKTSSDHPGPITFDTGKQFCLYKGPTGHGYFFSKVYIISGSGKVYLISGSGKVYIILGSGF